MANKVTTEDIIRMNELYLKFHTYAAVARETGFSASTVSKYVNKNYKAATERKYIRFNPNFVPRINTAIFNNVENFGDLCVLSNKEKEEIKTLWEELDL